MLQVWYRCLVHLSLMKELSVAIRTRRCPAPYRRADACEEGTVDSALIFFQFCISKWRLSVPYECYFYSSAARFTLNNIVLSAGKIAVVCGCRELKTAQQHGHSHMGPPRKACAPLPADHKPKLKKMIDLLRCTASSSSLSSLVFDRQAGVVTIIPSIIF